MPRSGSDCELDRPGTSIASVLVGRGAHLEWDLVRGQRVIRIYRGRRVLDMSVGMGGLRVENAGDK